MRFRARQRWSISSMTTLRIVRNADMPADHWLYPWVLMEYAG
jgi:hypothetical protein